MEAKGKYEIEALEYISKLSEGGMRDAITLMDKCLAFSDSLTLENVVETLGTVDYTTMFKLTDCFYMYGVADAIINIIETVHNAGKDVKQFIKLYTYFILDLIKIRMSGSWKYAQIPQLNDYEEKVKAQDINTLYSLLDVCVKLNSSIKYSNNAKLDVEAELLLFYNELFTPVKESYNDRTD